MAKRFSDTEKWKKEWFRRLPVKMKAVWEYLRDNCDHAGLWSADWGLISFQVGEPVTAQECVQAFGEERFVRLKGGKFLLPSFVEFQYGNLSPTNNTHRSVLNLLKRAGADQLLLSPSGGDQDTDKDTGSDTDKDQDKEKDTDTENAREALAPSVAVPALTPTGLKECTETWKRTLRHFKGERELLAAEEEAIARAILRLKGDSRSVSLALVGPREQPKDDKFDPGKFLNLERILSREKFNMYLNLGAQWLAKREGRAS